MPWGAFALGYLLAALASPRWLKWIEPTNIFAAFVALAVTLALLSPIADPARIAVADQVARLESGRISPDEFDYAFLRFKSGRYGLDALERLRTKQDGPDAARIAERADAVIAPRVGTRIRSPAVPPPEPKRVPTVTIRTDRAQQLRDAGPATFR